MGTGRLDSPVKLPIKANFSAMWHASSAFWGEIGNYLVEKAALW
jgi:hypothetical protein